jgi:hypothetical protein
MVILTNSIDECRVALATSARVFAKVAPFGDWDAIDAISDDGKQVRIADHLGGFNSGTIGKWMTYKDLEVA